MSNTLAGWLSIRKISKGNAPKIEIALTDKASEIEFVSATLSLEAMMQAITGKDYVPVDIKVRLLNVGRKLEVSNLEFEMPADNPCNKAIAADLAELALTDDWESDGYFCAQNSFFNKDGKPYARVTIRRWVENSDG